MSFPPSVKYDALMRARMGHIQKGHPQWGATDHLAPIALHLAK